MKSHLVNFVVAGMILLFCQNTFAQGTATISPQRLALIEQEMFNDSNERFIVVDLVMDGLLKPLQAFELMYDKGIMYYNGRKMEDKWQDKYSARLKEFFSYTGSPDTYMNRISSILFSEEEILDPTSYFRKPEFNMVKNIAQYKREHPKNDASQPASNY